MYNLVFALLIAECGLLSFFLLPLPLTLRKQALVFLSTNAIVSQVLYVIRICFIFIAMLLLDAWRVVYNESSHHEEDLEMMAKKSASTHSHVHFGEPHARLWRAQRNLCWTLSL